MNSNGFFSSKCFGEETNIFRTWWTENSGENIRQAQNLRNKIMGHVKRTPPLLHSPHLHPSTLLSFLSFFFFSFLQNHLWSSLSYILTFRLCSSSLMSINSFLLFLNLVKTNFCNIF